MKNLLLTCAALCTAAALPMSAHATTFDMFTLTGGGHTVSFTLPSSPTPSAVGFGCPTAFPPEFCINSVSVKVDSATSTYTAEFFGTASHGGLDLTSDGGNTFLLSQEGDKLYTGSTTDPTFRLGTFSLENIGENRFTNDFSLTIAASPVPEPSSIALLGTGLFGVVGAVRRRLS